MHVLFIHSEDEYDQELKERVRQLMVPCQRRGDFTLEILELNEGDHPQVAKTQMETADMVIIMGSPSMVASDLGYEVVKHAVERHKRGDGRTINLAMRSCVDSDLDGTIRFPRSGTVVGMSSHECENCHSTCQSESATLHKIDSLLVEFIAALKSRLK